VSHQRTPAPRLPNSPAGREAGADISGGGTMNQTMPIVKVKDLRIALAAYIAQKRREE
jgi:hypothetical protein